MTLIAEAAKNIIPEPTWMYGVGAFIGLAVLLYVVTRLNPYR